MEIENDIRLKTWEHSVLKKAYFDYDGVYKDSYSATTLIQPIQKTILEHRYKKEIKQNTSQLLKLWLGTIIHKGLEYYTNQMPNTINEKRLYTKINLDGKEITIHGKPDITVLDGYKYRIKDIKTASSWKLSYNPDLTDYKLQLSIYRWLMERNGYKTHDHGDVWLIYTDHNKYAVGKTNYPDFLTQTVEIELDTIEDTEDYIYHKVYHLEQAKQKTDDKLPNCDNQDLWVGKDGIARRCQYCPIHNHCSQYKKMFKGEKKDE